MNFLSGLIRVCALGLTLAFAGLSLGCDPGLGQKQTETRDIEWTPHNVSIQCSHPDRCPSHQGILFGYWHESGYIRFERCTASLYDSTHIITAGHCRMEKAEATYFLPVPKPGLNNNMISVRYVTGEAIKQGLDYAAFELNEKVSGRDYVRPARDIAPGPLEMVALVVNKAGYGKDMYLLDSVECSNIADGMSNMTVLDNPKRFYLHECIVLGGNSGGSVFRKGNLTDVYGLVSTGTDDPQLSNERENRRALFGEINWTGVTNARCVQLPGWPVVEPNCRDGLWN